MVCGWHVSESRPRCRESLKEKAMTQSSSRVPGIETALTESVVAPACGQHDTCCHQAYRLLR